MFSKQSRAFPECLDKPKTMVDKITKYKVKVL